MIHQTQCETDQSRQTPHARKAATHMLGAKAEIVRAIWRTPKQSPAYRRLQQLAGAISLLIGIIELPGQDEPAEAPTFSDSRMDVSR